MAIYLRNFNDRNTMIIEAANLLQKHMQMGRKGRHAIMLSGGRTPLPIYERIADSPFKVSPELHIMMSDERMVPENSPDNNFKNAANMISSLGIPGKRILKVRTSLPLETAAMRYNDDIAAFFRQEGRLTLALLGLGADGHTASLFRDSDLLASRGKFAIPVSLTPLFDRVSATPDTIKRAEQIIFITSGREKNAVIDMLNTDPDSVIAGQVTKGTAGTELWYAP
jgi:6-phosphogluconolactonase